MTPDDHKTLLAAGTEKHSVATADDISQGHEYDDGDYLNENGQGSSQSPYFIEVDRKVADIDVPEDIKEKWDDAEPSDFPAHWLEHASNNDFYPGYLPKLDPEVKAGWLEDLRSGNFNQCKSDLKRRDDDGNLNHCCLGVLYERFDGAKSEPKPGGGFIFKEPAAVNGGFTQHESMPGAKVRQWAGLPYKVASVLAEANDAGATFAEIAEFIDKEM